MFLSKGIDRDNIAGAFSKFEHVFTVASIVIYMNAVVPLLIIQGASEGDGVNILAFNYTPLNILFILNYLISVTLLFLRWQKLLYFIYQNLFFLAFLLVIPLSFVWSARPDETLTGSIGLIGTTLFGLYMAIRFTLKEQLKLIAWSFGIVILLSFIFVVLLPKYGLMAAVHAGAVRGVFTHKNGLGKVMVLSNVVFLLLTLDPRPRRIVPWLGVFASSILIVASSSTAALLNGFMLASAVLLLGRIISLRASILIPILALSAVLSWSVSVWATDIATSVLDLFEKDLTLTGRADIWPVVIQKIQERPWLGYGFNGFWHGLDGESADVIRALRWAVPDSHNGFLDLALALGLFGLIGMLFITWVTLIKSISLARLFCYPEYLWPIVLILYFSLINFSESTLLGQNNIFWVLYTSTVFSVSVEFHEIVNQPRRTSKPLQTIEA